MWRIFRLFSLPYMTPFTIYLRQHRVILFYLAYSSVKTILEYVHME